jgi:preprotein translocase subunit SecF
MLDNICEMTKNVFFLVIFLFIDIFLYIFARYIR